MNDYVIARDLYTLELYLMDSVDSTSFDYFNGLLCRYLLNKGFLKR